MGSIKTAAQETIIRKPNRENSPAQVHDFALDFLGARAPIVKAEDAKNQARTPEKKETDWDFLGAAMGTKRRFDDKKKAESHSEWALSPALEKMSSSKKKKKE